MCTNLCLFQPAPRSCTSLHPSTYPYPSFQLCWEWHMKEVQEMEWSWRKQQENQKKMRLRGRNPFYLNEKFFYFPEIYYFLTISGKLEHVWFFKVLTHKILSTCPVIFLKRMSTKISCHFWEFSTIFIVDQHFLS